ncbi:MAG: TIGR03067 domain-containing protein [Pirellulaceae bacterium]|nr:TIGR03067 domain-containing protein [Pirellulaceae bacterium]
MRPNRWKVFVSLVAVAGAVILASSSRSEPVAPWEAKDELRPLQGTWTLLAYAVDGRPLRGEDAYSILTVENDRWSITWRTETGGQQVEQGVIRIVDVTGRPKVMDLVHDFGPYKGTITRALFQLEGDSMRYSTLVVPAAIGDAKVNTATTTWKREPR